LVVHRPEQLLIRWGRAERMAAIRCLQNGWWDVLIERVLEKLKQNYFFSWGARLKG
jgi:hypothetical protein